MPAKDQWPQGEVWGLHDFTTHGAQSGGSCGARSRGPTAGPRRAGVGRAGAVHQLRRPPGDDGGPEQAPHGRPHVDEPPCWPSFVWQTYDYYLEPTAGYFGRRRVRAPAHPVELAGGHGRGRQLQRRPPSASGSRRRPQPRRIRAVGEDRDGRQRRGQRPVAVHARLSQGGADAVHFVRLKLPRAGRTVSENTYMRSLATYTVPGFSRGPFHIPTTRV